MGKPKANEQAQVQKQIQADAAVRNQVEGKFGVAKRRFSLARVMAKLAPTAETTLTCPCEALIAVTVLVMNLEQLLRQLFWFFFVVMLTGGMQRPHQWQRQWHDPPFLLTAA